MTNLGHWEYRSMCNGHHPEPDEGWTDDLTIAEDEAALLGSIGKTGVRIDRRWRGAVEPREVTDAYDLASEWCLRDETTRPCRNCVDHAEALMGGCKEADPDQRRGVVSADPDEVERPSMREQAFAALDPTGYAAAQLRARAEAAEQERDYWKGLAHGALLGPDEPSTSRGAVSDGCADELEQMAYRHEQERAKLLTRAEAAEQERDALAVADAGGGTQLFRLVQQRDDARAEAARLTRKLEDATYALTAIARNDDEHDLPAQEIAERALDEL